jgi:XTP/dITP diphosphohydrolase
MKTIVIATNNLNKVREFQSLLGNSNIEFKSLKQIGYDKEIIEDGNTFEENAYKKASQVAKDLNVTAIADDSGLSVYALNLAPGIYSARYAGTGKDEDNNELLIKNLQGKEDRRAYYSCAISICHPDGSHLEVCETCEGIIIDEARGKNGFGYDPHFFIPEFNKTFAEVSLEKKNTISHRAKAIRRVSELINEDFSFKR